MTDNSDQKTAAEKPGVDADAECRERLLSAFAAVSDPVLRARILDFLESLAAEDRGRATQ